MRWDWLLPDPAHEALLDGWGRQEYRPRHGQPPRIVRAARWASDAAQAARERYAGTVDEEPQVAGVTAAD